MTLERTLSALRGSSGLSLSALMMAAGLSLSACGGSSQTPVTPRDQSDQQYDEEKGELPEIPYDFDAPPEPTSGTATLEERWWEAEVPCPPGSTKAGGVPPEHETVGCKTDKNKNVGRMTRFFPNGQKKEEGQFEDHFAEGTFTEWNDAGQKVAETPYKAGKKHGLETIWYPGGGIKSQRPYDGGKRHGVVFIWDEQGRKRTAAPYERGLQHGFEARYDMDGKLARVIVWQHGREQK